jgi:hypothetical protein
MAGEEQMPISMICLTALLFVASQAPTPNRERGEDAAAFKAFLSRVQTYVKLQHTIVSTLPSFKTIDTPERISAYQDELARKIREARPRAKAGDLIGAAAREAFRHAAEAAQAGARARGFRKDVTDEPRTDMRLVVNEIYPANQPKTAVSPRLLAAFPPLPVELEYGIVGRTLIVLDRKAQLIVDVARLVLPPVK